MQKLLTISVAAYKVERYLPETLDSFLIPSVREQLEVLIINDGSGEAISEIAREYEKKYPQIFRLIEKENGGHGSTVNRGIEEAQGKYFKTVDGDDRLVGIITFDDAMDVMEEEATEDIEKMAAILPTDKPYFQTGVIETWKHRIPWLLLLMISATFTGTILGFFEQALAANAALTLFIPMLMDTGGNSGGQASVTIIRAMSLGDVEFADWLRVIWKELRVSVLCALTLGTVVFVKVMLVDRKSVTVASVVALTIFFTIVIAKLIGCTLPMLAKRLGFDPAVMASPFITTVVDALSLLVYFAIATRILGL